MNYLEYCKQHDFTILPIKIKFQKTATQLEDGSLKIKKTPKCEVFKTENDLKNYYGELSEWILKNRKHKNSTFDKVIIKTNMNDFDNKELCAIRWKNYNNGNPQKYNCFAVCTRKIGIIDIDCVLNPNDEYSLLLANHPYKRSATKTFGKHILFDRTDIPYAEKRRKTVLREGVGPQGDIEHLDGLWEWNRFDDEIQNPEKELAKIPFVEQSLLEQSKKSKKTKKTKKVTTKCREATGVSGVSPLVFPLEIIKENIMKYPIDKLAEIQICAGIIISFASSQNEDIYNIILDACKQQGANYSNEEWVKKKWDSYDPLMHESYKKRFQEYWCKKFELAFNWNNFQKDSNKATQERFVAHHKKNFIHNTDYKRPDCKLCYFNKDETLWEHDPKSGIGKGRIHNLLRTEDYYYWKTILEKALDKIEDKESEFYLAKEEFTNKYLAQYFSTGNWISGTVKNIYNTLLYNPNLKKEIQFNLMEKTKHYFQFKNKSFNLKTGALEPRTRDMYITREGCLPYEYPENKTDLNYKTEIDLIKKIIKQIHPDDDIRNNYMRWRGYCLTGEIKEQLFYILLGVGSNGKSLLCQAFEDAFPCYVRELGGDAFSSSTKDDKAFSSLSGKPVRLLYMEEFGKAQQNPEKMKSVVNGDSMKIKPLFCEEQHMKINFKLEALSNNTPSFADVDGGLARRGRLINFNSKFVSADEQDRLRLDGLDEHIYLRDSDLRGEFKFNKMKVALFRLFAPYAKQYYMNGLNTNFGQEDFASAAGNEWDKFCNEALKEYESGTTIHKHIMMNEVLAFFEGEDPKFSLVKSNLRKRNWKYESQMRETGGLKGFFVKN